MFEESGFYRLDNPCRKKLVAHPGAVVPGHPILHPPGEDFRERFGEIYREKRAARPA